MAKEKKKIFKYLMTSGTIYIYCILFSLFALVFLVDTIPKVVSVIFGFVFFAPILMLVFASGKTAGERAFKLNAQQQMDSNSNVYKAVKMNYIEIVYSLLGFAAPLLILIILGVALNNTIIHAIPFIIFMPASLIFSTLGVVTTDPITAWSIAVYIPSILIVCGMYVFGYLKRVRRMINDRREIATELRMFNN